MRFTRVFLPLAVLAIALLIPAALALPLSAQEGAPSVPHAIPGHVDCLGCHGRTVRIGEEHQGRTDDTCTSCHPIRDNSGIPALPHPTQGREGCLDCHAAGKARPFTADHAFQTTQACLQCHPLGASTTTPAPAIPHSTAGRADCLVCHGLGMIRPFPANHDGRGKETCLGCHQEAATVPVVPSTSVVPTPISEPQLFGENSCVTCHEALGGTSAQSTGDWNQSIHAAEGVGCVSCHGGNPNESDAGKAMSAAAGFVGVPAKGEIPGLCASCHSNVELMRPYNIAIDQFEQFWQSQHGKALVQGDQRVATCFDCHGGHRVMKVQDPTATVYPTNEPGMCAGCHADTELMAGYGISADQFEQYKGSVHGQAVLARQDLRAPTCSTCHGIHGATPPGFTQVATVCGQCHAKTQEYYQQGVHGAGLTGESGPGCVTCHGQHDVTSPTRDMYVGAQPRHCGECHAPGTETAGQVDAILQSLKGADDAYAQAQTTIEKASAERLIVTQQIEMLQKANTPLIESRALQHTVNVAEIEAKASESVALSDQARGLAEAALKDVGTRRVAMYVALGAILLTILALVLVKRQLDRDLEAQRSQKARRTT